LFFVVFGLRLVRSLLIVFDIPIQNIRGHRDFDSAKTCPGKFFDIDKFKDDLIRMGPPVA